jgi:hypothetical protein
VAIPVSQRRQHVSALRCERCCECRQRCGRSITESGHRPTGAGLLFPREDAFYVESFLKWFITLTEEVRVSVRQMSLEERPLSCA